MNEQKSIIDRLNEKLSNSVTLKLIIITLLTLLLLIPGAMIKSIIHERLILRETAIQEVSGKWANAQELNGPIVSIPMEIQKEVGGELIFETKYLHIVPQVLNIGGEVTPSTLHRGIYDVVVYQSGLSIHGTFSFDPIHREEGLKKMLWDQAFITLGISDLRGIRQSIDFQWDGNALEVEPGSRIPGAIISGITLPLPKGELTGKNIDFSYTLDLQGSKNLSFIPVGKTTTVQLQSPWTNPSFGGNFLPDHREIKEDGFQADWTVLQLNRNFPQQWAGQEFFNQMRASSFGVELMLPMDDYQKSLRMIKYGIMPIALTFLIFFLVEIRNKKRIHPIQYTFVGLALSLFYILLVSISEHLGFNLAYGMAAFAIIIMSCLYSLTVFRNKKLSLILLIALTAIFGFLFINLQLADYALLLGSIGLTFILAITMYLTRNINWYGSKREGE